MPKRTNLFQEVVEIVHRHMAGDAPVESPTMLRDAVMGTEREVDVVIRSNSAGYEVVVSVEAIDRSRKASVEWVEQMLSKHANLPTNKLVLVSEKGFYAPARALAEKQGAVPVAPEDIENEDPAERILGGAASLWPKQVKLIPEKARVEVDQGDAGKGWFWAQADLIVWTDQGEEVGVLSDVILEFYKADWPKLMEESGLAEVSEDLESPFVFVIGPPLMVIRDGVPRPLYLRGEEDFAGELHPIEQIKAVGNLSVTVTEVPISRKRLGEVTYAYGEGKIGSQDALIVASENVEGKGMFTVRLRNDAK